MLLIVWLCPNICVKKRDLLSCTQSSMTIVRWYCQKKYCCLQNVVFCKAVAEIDDLCRPALGYVSKRTQRRRQSMPQRLFKLNYVFIFLFNC